MLLSPCWPPPVQKSLTTGSCPILLLAYGFSLENFRVRGVERGHRVMFVPAWVPVTGRIFKTVTIEEDAYWFNTHVTTIF